ncbi:uncharacterized protein A4U43_C02F10740 [Asparagus officinalis]|uniref:Uncharacterized protein n=1 Tax=Asparagus officinalis TaxID=4686 RepID=A0A5P1FHD6_ASPOF|nr:uncharacterized protein A4U43_C02F10740 [Asparagus officinalis]
MATPLGTSFSDKEVVVQSDVHLTGTTVETLIIEFDFDQAKYEETLSSGSLSPKAMRKIHKVSEETKAPVVANSSKNYLPWGLHCSYSPLPKGEDSISAQRQKSRSSNQRELRVYEPQHELCKSPAKRNSQECVSELKRNSQECVSQTERNSQECVSESERRSQDCVSLAKRRLWSCVNQAKHDPRVPSLEHDVIRRVQNDQHGFKIHVYQEPVPSFNGQGVPSLPSRSVRGAKETKAPKVAPMPKETLSFSRRDYSSSPTSKGVGSVYAKRSPQWCVVQSKRSLQNCVDLAECNSQECVSEPKRNSQECVQDPKRRLTNCVNQQKRNRQRCVSSTKRRLRSSVSKTEHDPRVSSSEHDAIRRVQKDQRGLKIHVHQEPVSSFNGQGVPSLPSRSVRGSSQVSDLRELLSMFNRPTNVVLLNNRRHPHRKKTLEDKYLRVTSNMVGRGRSSTLSSDGSETDHSPSVREITNEFEGIYQRTRTRTGAIPPINYQSLARGTNSDDEHSAIAESQSSSSFVGHESFVHMAEHSEDLSKRLDEQEAMLKSQQEAINELMAMLTQIVADKAKSQETDSPLRQESSRRGKASSSRPHTSKGKGKVVDDAASDQEAHSLESSSDEGRETENEQNLQSAKMEELEARLKAIANRSELQDEGEGLSALVEVNPLYARRFEEKIYRYSGATRYLEELQHTNLGPKIQWAINNARLKEEVAARARALDISERKARIWNLQKQRCQSRARLNAGELTQEEFSLEDATLEARVLQRKGSATAVVSDVELCRRVKEEVLAKHEKVISNTEAHLLSLSLL